MDPEQERIRLAELYSSLAEGELQELADDWESLTDAAHQALKNEMARRRMHTVEAAVTPTVDSAGLLDPVTVAEFPNLEEALLAKGLLESGGIQCALGDEGNTFLDPEGFIGRRIGHIGTGYTQYGEGGIKLQVNKADLEAALEVLNQFTSAEPEPEG